MRNSDVEQADINETSTLSFSGGALHQDHTSKKACDLLLTSCEDLYGCCCSAVMQESTESL